jgi:CRP-like cAMP-binding protein
MKCNCKTLSGIPSSAARLWSVPFDALQSARKNRLLAALPLAEWQRWLPHLEWVDMPPGRVLHESGHALDHVYFPTTAIVSLLNVTQDGASTEIAVVGNEGVVGTALFMGSDSTCSRAVVQSGGFGFRLKARPLRDEFERSGVVMHLLLRYTQALMTQMAQLAVCNRHHSIAQQLCRCLLVHLDRLGGQEIVMTHESIASMLGVRREGVTETALKLAAAGLIRYARGRITVLDRAGLEQRACECYGVVSNEYDRLLSERVAA